MDIFFEMQKIGISCRRSNTDLEIGESMVCLLTLGIQNSGACGLIGEVSSIDSGPFTLSA